MQRLKSAKNTERLGRNLLVLMKSVLGSIITVICLTHTYLYKNSEIYQTQMLGAKSFIKLTHSVLISPTLYRVGAYM